MTSWKVDTNTSIFLPNNIKIVADHEISEYTSTRNLFSSDTRAGINFYFDLNIRRVFGENSRSPKQWNFCFWMFFSREYHAEYDGTTHFPQLQLFIREKTVWKKGSMVKTTIVQDYEYGDFHHNSSEH